MKRWKASSSFVALAYRQAGSLFRLGHLHAANSLRLKSSLRAILAFERFRFSLFILIALVSQASAAGLETIFESSHGLPGESIKPGSGESWVVRFFTFVVTVLQDITAIVSVLGICIVGLLLIMSQGDEEKTAAAKKYIIAILIGLVLALSAWAIIAVIDLIPTSIRF